MSNGVAVGHGVSARDSGRYWLSRNPDKAWGEKFYLELHPGIPEVYNGVIQKMGWLDVGNFWHLVQNIGMWVPYCVLLPAWLRRNSGVRWSESYWFKFNLYMFVYVFFATYFHTEYFFSPVLGIPLPVPRSDALPGLWPCWSRTKRRPWRGSKRYRWACTSTRWLSSSSITPPR